MLSKEFSVRQSGQSLMELVVVVAVAVIVISALVFATIGSLRNATFAKNQAQATKLAQEGLERVRTGRDRNQCINGLDAVNVNSWNGSTDCPSPVGSIWVYRISGDCDRPDLETYCYFNTSPSGALQNIGSSATFPSTAEGIPPPPDDPVFRRVITLSDDDDYKSAKKITSIVRWTDFSGEHESKLTTILRNPNL